MKKGELFVSKKQIFKLTWAKG